MLIIAHDPNVQVKRRSVIVKKSYPSSRVARELGIFHIWRTNGITTEHLRIGLVCKDGGYVQQVLNRTVDMASDSDIYYYQNEMYPNDKRNDELVKACNKAYNRFLDCGYLSKRHGVRGWVRPIDASTVKIFLNTEVGSRVISALLYAWNPNYTYEIIGGNV